MPKTIITSSHAPAAVGPYSQAVKANGMLFLAGQIPLDTAGNMVSGGISEQTMQVFKNIQAILAEAGLTLDHVVKTTVFLQDMVHFAALNEVYAKHFKQNPPARSTIQVARLPKDALVEIEVVAVFDK